MRQLLLATICSLGLAGALGACTGEGTSTHVNALTGDTCEPNSSYMPAPPRNDRCQGTSNGDNCDDLSSGKIDCIGDGNSGQGDDKKHGCEFPQPGCDDDGCCDDDLVEPPPPGDEAPPPDGDGGDDGGGDPPPGEPPADGSGAPPIFL